jgi:hypothetical protein
MAQQTPTNLTIYYASSSSAVIPIPTVSSVPIEVSLAIRNIQVAGGFSFYDANNLFTYVPFSAITKITAA